MKKQLKDLIKTLKLSDDQIIKLIESSNESDVMDEDDEAEDSVAPIEEQSTVEKDPTSEGPVTKADIAKMIADALGRGTTVKATTPAKSVVKKIKKELPNAKAKEEIDIGGFQMIG